MWNESLPRRRISNDSGRKKTSGCLSVKPAATDVERGDELEKTEDAKAIQRLLCWKIRANRSKNCASDPQSEHQGEKQSGINLKYSINYSMHFCVKTPHSKRSQIHIDSALTCAPPLSDINATSQHRAQFCPLKDQIHKE